LFVCLLAACAASPVLEEGRWTGTLTPMNHPEMETPVGYEVRHADEGLSIVVIGPGGERVPARRPRLEGDTLTFSFVEPADQVLLTCTLARTRPPDSPTAGFAGRCVDPTGKWAQFTMRRPEA
jgi:hypothetical protein